MSDLQNPKVIWIKGFLFAVISFVSAILLLLHAPTFRTAVLLALCVWSACRFYYFAFYVIQHYVDPRFRFTGLLDFARYLVGRRPVDDP